MNRMFAIIEREMRKFFRSPVLMIMSMMLPIVQLVILGHALGGHVTGARVGVVDEDRGPQAVKIKEAFDSVAVNIATFTTIPYADELQAREDVRTGKIDGAVIIPPQFSRRVYAKDSPRIALVVDNTDQIMSGSIESEMQSLVGRAQPARHSGTHRQRRRSADRGNLPVRRVHEVPARRLDRARHVHLSHDRRRDALHR